jgi:DNA-binding Xre family transcriptional regulator
MAHAEHSRSPAQSAVSTLIEFLTRAGHTLSLVAARKICEELSLLSPSDLRKDAQTLRVGLDQHGIKLRHTHALEAVAQMAGHSSWMRANVALAAAAPTSYRTLLAVEGVAAPARAFDSLSEAVSSALEEAISGIALRNEPAFCELFRTETLIRLDIKQQSKPWFSVEITRIVRSGHDASGEPNVLPFEAEEMRRALVRLGKNIEQARPATLVLHKDVAEALPPWLHARWFVKELSSGFAHVDPDEKALFMWLSIMQFDGIEHADGVPRLKRDKGPALVERGWFDAQGNCVAREPASHPLLLELMRRYKRNHDALPEPLVVAILNVADDTARSEKGDAFLDERRLESALAAKHWTKVTLAQQAGLTYKAVHQLRDRTLSAPSIIRIASLLGVQPGSLTREGHYHPVRHPVTLFAGKREALDWYLTVADSARNNPAREELQTELGELMELDNIKRGAEKNYQTPRWLAFLKKVEASGLQLSAADYVHFEPSASEPDGYSPKKIIKLKLASLKDNARPWDERPARN